MGLTFSTARKDKRYEDAEKRRMIETEMRRREMECKIEKRIESSSKPNMELRPSGIKNPKPTTDFGF